jgi:hypothetical protein
MKTAKEMFEKLGFDVGKIYSREDVVCYHNYGKISVYFHKNKSVGVHSNGNYSIINIELLQAINKQVEELGWNNEER